MSRYAPPQRQHALLDELTGLVRLLHDGEAEELSAFGADDAHSVMLRLVGVVFELVRRHPVDDGGRCRQCRRNRSGCRRWLRWPTKKAPCLILSVASFYSTVPIEQVWLQLLAHIGINRELREIRAWLAGDSATAASEPIWPAVDEPASPSVTEPVPTIPLPGPETPSGRHALTA
jgi:hypothetical protein